jgi:hypothetical protein
MGALVRTMGAEVIGELTTGGTDGGTGGSTAGSAGGIGLAAGDTIAVTTDSSEGSWLVRSAISETLLGRGVVVTGAGTGTVVRLSVAELRVSYADAGDAGLFSSRSIKRSVSAAFRADITKDDRILASRRYERSADDVVAEDDIPSLENDGLPFTQGTVPHGSSVDRIIEPLVIIGAVGTAIFLFFHIRS